MVHGISYGVQYEILLNKNIDFYDDLLPLWISVRAKIELKKTNGLIKLIVIPYDQLDSQLPELFKEYRKQVIIKHVNSIEEYLKTQKFLMVREYSLYVKHNTNLPEPISEIEFQNLRQESENDYKKLDELRIQRVIHNPEYFAEIKMIEQQLTNIELTNDQNELVNKVLTYPKLEGLITWHGFNISEIFW
jgi:hypothetical protein